jgi:hypothetical protein
MGNKCLSPCPAPLTDVKSKFRCSYFCCLKGATINVIHTGVVDDNSELDDVDGVKTDSILWEKRKEKSTLSTLGIDILTKNGV